MYSIVLHTNGTPMYGDTMLPIRAKDEDEPSARCRTGVWNISDVYT